MSSNLFNSMIYSYLLTLGEFNTDSFASGQALWLWAFFVFSTFILQITFLNMLIAIMSDTFDKVMETRLESGLRAKIEMLADFRIILKLLRIDLSAQYVLVITPPEEMQDEENWQGKLSTVKTFIKRETDELMQQQRISFFKIEDDLKELLNLKQIVDTVKKNVDKKVETVN